MFFIVWNEISINPQSEVFHRQQFCKFLLETCSHKKIERFELFTSPSHANKSFYYANICVTCFNSKSALKFDKLSFLVCKYIFYRSSRSRETNPATVSWHKIIMTVIFMFLHCATGYKKMENVFASRPKTERATVNKR